MAKMNEYQLIKSIINNVRKEGGNMLRLKILPNKHKDLKKFDYSQHVSTVRGFKTELVYEFSDGIDGCDYHSSRAFQLPNKDYFIFDYT